jgi:hypothetical protein
MGRDERVSEERLMSSRKNSTEGGEDGAEEKRASMRMGSAARMRMELVECWTAETAVAMRMGEGREMELGRPGEGPAGSGEAIQLAGSLAGEEKAMRSRERPRYWRRDSSRPVQSDSAPRAWAETGHGGELE